MNVGFDRRLIDGAAGLHREIGGPFSGETPRLREACRPGFGRKIEEFAVPEIIGGTFRSSTDQRAWIVPRFDADRGASRSGAS